MVVEKIETFACRLWKKSAEPAELGLVQLFDVFFIKGLGQRQATSYRIYYQWIDYWMILCFFFLWFNQGKLENRSGNTES